MMSSWLVPHMGPKTNLSFVSALIQRRPRSSAAGWTTYDPNSRDPMDVGGSVAAAVATVSACSLNSIE